MRKQFIFLSALMMLSVAQASEVKVTGAEAEKIFNSLENQFEYKSGVSVSGIVIETIVRHDVDSVSCTRESVQYGDAAALITYECILK